MTLVAEVVDAVTGGDTHKDTHALEMTAPTGATIATLVIDNYEAGFATALAWIVEHTDEWAKGRGYLGLDVPARSRLTASSNPDTEPQIGASTIPTLTA
ncbi:MAG: hypothetical protein M3Y49_07605 [Actinomycetota bacterium]|nr:hypothetical protein [Actinomycetota bacterium]